MLVKTLSTELAKRQSVNPRYSLRAFARDLGVSPTTLSLVLSGKRKLSEKSLEKIVASIDLSKSEQKDLIRKVYRTDFEEISIDTLRLVSDWYYFAILSLMETKSFRSQPTWIAKRLGISKRNANEALVRLEKLGMVKKQGSGSLTFINKQYKTSDMIPSAFVKKSHLQALDLARQSILNDPIEKRNISAMTVAIDKSRLPEAVEMIGKFRRKITKFLESGTEKQEVYRLCIQLFPVSKEVDDE